MRLLFQPLLALFLTFACVNRTAHAEVDINGLNSIGKAMTFMLSDTHFEALRLNENLNERILNLYLNSLDPDKLYFTQKDVDEFRRKYAGRARNPFDMLLLRSRGMEPARDIYTRFATRVVERTEYIETLTDKAAFDFTSDKLVPLSRDKSPWPQDNFGAQIIWHLKISDELLTEQMLREELIVKKEQPLPKEKQVPSESPLPNHDRPHGNDSPLPIVSEKRTEVLRQVDSPASPEDSSDSPPAPIIEEESPRKVIKTRYLRFKETVQSASNEEIADYFFSAVAQAHDPHSTYLSEKENERFDRALRNQLTGVGAEFKSSPDGSTLVTGIVLNGPAHRQGQLQPNDRIVAIDQLNNGKIVDITYLPIERVLQLILGQKNTEVGLIIENRTSEDNKKRKVVIRRDTFELKNGAASAEVIRISQSESPPLVLGWLTIPSFYFDTEDADPSVYSDVKRLVSRLKREKIDGIAIDLRGNTGGDLNEVPRLAGLFLPRGPVVQVKTQNGTIETLPSEPLKADYDGPLVVITDRHSASSSEIFAAALQDHNRAIIVGESATFGKGTVQEKLGIAKYLRFMQDPRRAGELKTTVQKFYRVTGSSTQLYGVIPHILVPSLNDSLDIGERYLPHALPHDRINSARNFRPFSKKGLFLPFVAEKSRQRVLDSPDFNYIRKDLIKAESKRLKNVATLNRNQRFLASSQKQQEATTRNAERKKRFAKMAMLDSQRFHFLRLTLDDIEQEKLKTVDRIRDSQAFMIQAKTTHTDPSAPPPWPSSLDPVKREAIAILEDFIIAKKADEELAELKKAVEDDIAN